MSEFQTRKDYSHCIVGVFTMEPPDADQLNSFGKVNAEQYMEASATGGAVAFRFLRELILYPNGGFLYDAYHTSLKLLANLLIERANKYIKSTNIRYTEQHVKGLVCKRKFVTRLRIFVPRIQTGNVDTEVLFFLDGSEEGEDDLDKIFKAVDPVIISKMAMVFLNMCAQAHTEHPIPLPEAKDVDAKS